MTEFGPILQATLTPVALISGVGLLLLSMVNRYNHAIDRIRELLREKELTDATRHAKLDASIQVIYSRCKTMRNAILCVGLSIVASGSIVFASALEGLTGLNLLVLKELLLVGDVGLIVIAAILFVIEVSYSLRALQLELE